VTSISNPHVYGYYKVAGASEPSSTWTLSGSVANSGGVARYTGVSNLSPLDGAAATGTSATAVTTAGVPGATTVSPNAMLVGCVGINSSSTAVTIATPADLGEAWDIGGKRQELADGLQAANTAAAQQPGYTALTWLVTVPVVEAAMVQGNLLRFTSLGGARLQIRHDPPHRLVEIRRP